MKRLLILCLILVLLVTGCGLFPKEESKKKHPVNKTAVDTEYFTYITAEKGDVSDCFSVTTYYGNQRVEDLAFDASDEELTYFGIYVKQGDMVCAGQVLAEVSLGSLEEEIENCQKNCEEIDKQYYYYEQMLAFEKERQTLAKNYGRTYDTKKLDDLTMQFNEYASRKKIADAKMVEADKILKGHILTASFDGIVTFVREFRPWERLDNKTFITVTSSDTGFLASVEDPSYVTVGNTYNLETDDGVITCILKSANPVPNVVGRYQLVFTPVQKDLEIENKTIGILNIPLNEAKDVVYIPTGALRQLDGEDVVYVVGQDGLREIRYVEIGLSIKDRVPSDMNRTEIKSGLSVGDKVIIQ